MFYRCLFGLALLGPPAADALAREPDPAEVQAEQRRLLDELTKLARKNAWSGVDRIYRSLEALGEPMPMQATLLGVTAARTAGDIALALDRLERGIAAQPSATDERIEAQQQLDDLQRRYGLVRVSVYTARVPRLDRSEMPFVPEERSAIEHARKKLSKDRRLLGMLPIGAYALDDVTFEVRAGAPVLDVRVGVPASSGSSVRID